MRRFKRSFKHYEVGMIIAKIAVQVAHRIGLAMSEPG